MQYRFLSIAWRLPLWERYESLSLWRVRTLTAKFEHWGEFRRTLTAITTLVSGSSGKFTQGWADFALKGGKLI
jgi:hypothetical protein